MDDFTPNSWRRCKFCDKIFVPAKTKIKAFCSEECANAARNIELTEHTIRKIAKEEAKARKKNVKEITRLSKEANKKHISYGQMIAKENAPHFDKETGKWVFK